MADLSVRCARPAGRVASRQWPAKASSLPRPHPTPQPTAAGWLDSLAQCPPAGLGGLTTNKFLRGDRRQCHGGHHGRHARLRDRRDRCATRAYFSALAPATRPRLAAAAEQSTPCLRATCVLCAAAGGRACKVAESSTTCHDRGEDPSGRLFTAHGESVLFASSTFTRCQPCGRRPTWLCVELTLARW